MRRVKSRAARGAAAVETALSLLVFVPVFLYALFLDDMLRHALDAQEAALSTIWDFTVQDYAKEPQNGEPFDGFSNVAGYVRFMYCDHESGIDSFDTGVEPRECGDLEDHHQEVVSHACWLIPGAQQVQCTLNGGGSEVGAYGVSLHQSYMDEFGRGGLIRCSARIGVQNYLLQRSVFAEFSKVDLAKDKQEKGNGVHGNASGGNESNAYLLPWERISIVTDTWALTRPNADIRPGAKEGQFFDRVAHVYTNQENQGYTQMQGDAERVVQEGVQNQQLADGLRLSDSTPSGDDPRQPSIAISPHVSGEPEESITQQGSQQSYFNSEWRDWGSNNNERTYQGRGNWYMGCQRQESC
ncbi:hypothetical protein [Pyxidicoccus trucidator]|uniref:hypothetical protein n=1 Tax=Pyxidicoccus trucidator TaxID=2709662 RepID=UPI001F074ADA|nr:hypothetical protein [Pyxidicoccus trucidator]